MFHKNQFGFFKSGCRKSVFFLAFSWIAGIIAGSFLSPILSEYSVPLMRMAVESRVSIIGLVVVILVPCLLSAIAVHLSKNWIIYLLSSVKGICFGFCIQVLLQCYGSAAWLLYILVLFSDICMLTPLFLFWIRHAYGSKQMLYRDMLYYFICAAIICIIDYLLISPSLLLLN